MAVSGLRFENALVESEWATAVLLGTNGLRKQSSCPARLPFPTAPISDGEAFIPLWRVGERSFYPTLGERAVTIVNSLMGGCGLSHERVEMAVRALVWILGLKTRQNWGYGKFNSRIG